MIALLAAILLGCSKAENSASAQGEVSTNQTAGSGVAQQDVNGTDIREGAGARTPGANNNLDERIRGALQSDPEFAADAERIKILVVDGRIILTGSVMNDAEKQNIEQRVRQMAGDTRIENRLRIDPNESINQR